MRGELNRIERSEKMSYYRTCPYCGANLDPGEVCDCRREKGDDEMEYIPDNYDLFREHDARSEEEWNRIQKEDRLRREQENDE